MFRKKEVVLVNVVIKVVSLLILSHSCRFLPNNPCEMPLRYVRTSKILGMWSLSNHIFRLRQFEFVQQFIYDTVYKYRRDKWMDAPKLIRTGHNPPS